MSDSACCGGADPQARIRALYTDLARHPERDFGWGKGADNARRLGYDEAWLQRLPSVVWESAAAVGNPFSAGPIMAGETVVDLGCGAGADACVAALLVGMSGKVYGIDATPAMVAKATGNGRAAGLGQLEFREADMAETGLPDGTADVVISNGAINLARDKARIMAEAFRLLGSGGRFQFADMVREEGAATCCASASWADCVSGTLVVPEIEALLRAAGFIDVALVGNTGYKTDASTVGAIFMASKP